ncbi:MAG: hypothetical protein GXX86_07610, partial [Propionibacterium sp.]|nr:hypothetical protein [Propionibacterium sp.]
MARWLRARALLLALVAVLLVGCAPSGNSTEVFCDRTSPGYCESLQDAGAGDAVRPGAQNWSAMELRRGSAVELFEVQAPADTRHPAVTSWRPDFQTTAVIVVDRSRTDMQITGWRDLAAAGLPVSFSRQSVDSWLLITAMSWGLADSLRPHPSALHLLGDLHRAGLLEPTPPDEPLGTPLSIAFSHQVADRIAAGENLEIVVPAEGTLSYVKGLASADELPPAGRLPDLLPDLLAEHGYRAPDAP